MEFRFGIVGLAFGILVLISPSRTVTEQKLAVTAMRADLNVVGQILHRVHPSTYKYAGKHEIEAAFREAVRRTGSPMEEHAFLAEVNRLLGHVRDGHTSAVPSSNLKAILRGAAGKIPVKLRFYGTRAFVLGTANGAVPLGAEVLSINGRSIRAIRKGLLPLLPADGDIQSGKRWKLNEDFRNLYWLYADQAPAFKLRLQLKGGHSRTVSVPALRDQDYKSKLKSPKWSAEDQTFGYRTINSSTAKLTIPTFAPPAEFNFPKFLSDSITDANRRHIKDLILDLRGNDGGESFGPAIASAVLAKPFRAYKSMTARTDDISMLTSFSHLDSDFVSNFAKSVVPRRKGLFEALPAAQPELAAQKPIPEPFKGKLWVLIDGEVFSAASALCSILKTEHRAIFVGEETGGAYSGFSGGDFVVATLPNSKIRMVVPMFRINLAVAAGRETKQGIKPDFTFEPDVESVTNGVDSELDFVRRLMSSRK